jgi:hypothetical protein
MNEAGATMNQAQQTFSQDEITAIVRRALLMQNERDEFTLQDLEEVAKQAGITSWYLREAIVHEREARDREEAKRRLTRRKFATWGAFAAMQLCLLGGWLFQISAGKAGMGLLMGWVMGAALGVPLIFFVLAGVEHQVFQKLQEKRFRRTEAMLATVTEAPSTGQPLERA